MNEVLAALEDDGLIVRSPAANHGRVVEVDLSQKGREQLLEALVNRVYRLGGGFGQRS